MRCHVGRALDKILLLQIVHQLGVRRMDGLGCENEIGKLVAGQGTPAVVIERFGLGAIDILKVMDRSYRHSCKERAFRDALSVEVGEYCHSFVEDRV